ncbi:CSC1-like protein At4g02900 [Zea mays]|uniref:CSC1-like protein n=2 Tax=Zea mays TaxID=4577 RepID=A0A1D6M4Q2_MAIZE|nr:CSC1-like protein At4g02900 [Zea mays]AQK86102.1 CSC1-like protein [Zea mays]AQK86111.1 CSC1-like protein [Zea mays]|eukprot:NP_001338619.1 CSC1-like protein At4g02900 [Zea mays]
MGSLTDIGVSAGLNILSAVGFLLAFAVLRIQPINDRVYFPKWYLKGTRSSPRQLGNVFLKFVNADFSTYIRFLNWMPAALKMPEPELIEHAGLDSAVYVRIYLLGLKIFVPIALLAFAVLVPVNWTSGTLENEKGLSYDQIDKLSISNLGKGSKRFWAHIAMSYVFTFWTFFVLYHEYKVVTTMRLRFLANQNRRPDQYTVLVRNVPPDPDESVSEHVEHFFAVNHRDHYLSHQIVYNANHLSGLVEKKKGLQNWLIYYENKHAKNPAKRPKIKTGLWGLWGQRVDAIEYYQKEIEDLCKQEDEERQKVVNDPNYIMPAAFVSFKTQWGAAVCAQTQQTSNPTVWLTEWAPEPRDVFWANLAIPFVELSVRRLIVAVAFFFLTFFFMIPIAIVQSLANLDDIVKVLPFLKPIIERNSLKSVIQGFLPGIILKIFLILLPTILMAMSKIEGHTSLSGLDRKTATKYYIFLFVNVFLGSVITGTAFQQLDNFIHQSANKIPEVVGESIPMKAAFFMTYIMVDGWSGIAAEVLRLKALVIFHIKNAFLVRTEHDREQAMDPGSLDFYNCEPRLQLYFLLGLVYAVVTPMLLPFIIVFFSLAYLVFRHQIINVYTQHYESGAQFWPDVHMRLIIALIVSQILLLGLLSTQEAEKSTVALLPLPVLSIWFHYVCKGRFEPAFVKFPLQDAMVKDTLERAHDPTLNLREYLKGAYVHPVFQKNDIYKVIAVDEEEKNPMVVTKRQSRMNAPAGS